MDRLKSMPWAISATKLCWHTVCLRPFQPQGYADTLSVWDQVWTVLLNHTAEMACVSAPLQHTWPKPQIKNPYHNSFQTNILFTIVTDSELSPCLQYSETADERPQSWESSLLLPRQLSRKLAHHTCHVNEPLSKDHPSFNPFTAWAWKSGLKSALTSLQTMYFLVLYNVFSGPVQCIFWSCTTYFQCCAVW